MSVLCVNVSLQFATICDNTTSLTAHIVLKSCHFLDCGDWNYVFFLDYKDKVMDCRTSAHGATAKHGEERLNVFSG